MDGLEIDIKVTGAVKLDISVDTATFKGLSTSVQKMIIELSIEQEKNKLRQFDGV